MSDRMASNLVVSLAIAVGVSGRPERQSAQLPVCVLIRLRVFLAHPFYYRGHHR
jgi:hypothetical protein